MIPGGGTSNPKSPKPPLSLRFLRSFLFPVLTKINFRRNGNKKARFCCAKWAFGIAEKEGFEPPARTKRTTVFETAPFDHSGISPFGYKTKHFIKHFYAFTKNQND